jgi:hypothetical protein
MEPNALMLIALIGAHCFFDYAGQGDFMAKAKNVASPIPGVSAMLVLWQHAAIHGAAVGLITGQPMFALAEMSVHATLDQAKCKGQISFIADQAAHIACKVFWFAGAWWLA